MGTQIPIHFPHVINNFNDEEAENIIGRLREKLDQGLYKWDVPSFRMEFPATLPRTAPSVLLSDLLQEPNYNSEIYDLAYDPVKHELRKLDFIQLQDIRKRGEFVVPSKKFPGENHIWRLTLLLQNGSEKTRATARRQYAFALTNLIIWIPNRLIGDRFSIPKGVKKIVKSVLWDLPSLLWGWIEKENKYSYWEVDAKVAEKKNKYLLEDIRFGSSYNPESTSLEANQVVTEDGTVFDFRLFNKKIYNMVYERLTSIQRKVNDEFYKHELKLQQQISNELAESGTTNVNFAQEVANRMVLEQQRILEQRIRNDPQIGHLAELILEALETRSVTIIAMNEFNEKRTQIENQTREELARLYPIRYLIPSWVEKRLNEVFTKFDEEYKHFILERSIQLAQERRLIQTEYFLKRELKFQQERESAIKMSLKSAQVPSKVFEFHRQIWNPKNWKIEKVEATIGTKSYYTCTKTTKSTVSSDTLFWRLRSIFYRTGTFWNNSLYLLYRNIVQGPLGFRALFLPSAFKPDTVLDAKTGLLITGHRTVQSFASRLGNLWKSIFESRRSFEQKPDIGFLGKSITRAFNVFWNYVIKGAIGTTLIVAFQPLLTILNITISTVLALTSMVWCPLGAILAHVFAVLFFDFQAPRYSRWAKLFPLLQILTRGILYGALQVGGSLVAVVAHLLLYVLACMGCGFNFTLRTLYDFLVFYLVIKWRARLPATNTFAAKRMKGPGLSRESYFQINPDLALVALQVKMESIEIDVCEQEILEKIGQAKRDSLAHINKYIGKLGIELSSNHRVVQELDENQSALRKKFGLLKKEREEKFPFRIENVPHRDKIVLERDDLESTLRRATLAVAQFYSTRILPRKSEAGREEFWESLRLLEEDWSGLTRSLLSSIFSEIFLSPLEEADKKVILKIEHASIHQYAEGLMDTGAIPDDLTVAHVEHPNYYQPNVPATVPLWDVTSLLYEDQLKTQVAAKYKKTHP